MANSHSRLGVGNCGLSPFKLRNQFAVAVKFTTLLTAPLEAVNGTVSFIVWETVPSYAYVLPSVCAVVVSPVELTVQVFVASEDPKAAWSV
jgi:hypothetical protein